MLAFFRRHRLNRRHSAPQTAQPLRLEWLDDRVAPSVTQAYVDDTWAGTAVGTNPSPDPVGGIVRTTGAQTYRGPVILGTDTSLTSTGGNVTFAGTVNGDGNGPRNLTVTTANANSLVQLNGAVGAVNPLSNLTINDAGPATIAGSIQGNGTTLTKTGPGTLTLLAANTYTGATTVSGGILLVMASTAADSAVTVSAAGTLGGTGTVGGAVAVGGALSPGASPGVLSTGGLTFGPGSTFRADVNSPFAVAGADYDQARVTGTVTVNGAVLDLAIGSVGLVGDRVITVIANDGTDPVSVTNPFLTPAGAPLPEGGMVVVGNFRANLSYRGGDGNDVVLTRAVPLVQGVGVNGGAQQRSMVTSLQVTFNSVVSLAPGAFTLTYLGAPAGPTGGVIGSTVGDFSVTMATVGGVTVATLSDFSGDDTLNGSLIDGRYSLTVDHTKIMAGGVSMASDYTFADGVKGASLYRLFGDATGDRVVNGADLTPFIQRFGGPDPAFDFNSDGVVNGADLTAFVARFGIGV